MRVLLISLICLLLIAGCRSGDGSDNPPQSDNGQPPAVEDPLQPGDETDTLIIESIEVDATAVELAAPAASSDIAGCEPEATTELPKGLLVFHENDQPTQLLVFTHGIGHTVEASWLPHMLRFARPGLAIVSTDYRDNDGFPILRGAHDTVAATLIALERFPSVETVYLLGVSMGGAVSGTAIVESTYVNGGRSLYDYWVNVEGVSQLAQMWALASLIAATGNETAIRAATGMERDTGGTPLECLPAYNRRSPAANVWAMADAGLRAVALIHAVNDGLVPYTQGREMALALAAAGIPAQYFTVLGVEAGQTPGTTITGSFGLGALDPILNLAGHASEADENHPVMRVGFENLELMLSGDYDDMTVYDEHIVDPTLDSLIN